MTFEQRKADFINKARTRLGVLQMEFIIEFDRQGYQSDRSEELQSMINQTLNLIELLFVPGYGRLTERQVTDLIDFFIIWLDLNKVLAANFINYTMPIVSNGGGNGGGSGVSLAQLNQEIQNRINGDAALAERILELEENEFDPSAIFPEGFWDNFNADYSVIFEDDERLHDHANLDLLDQIDQVDIENINRLTEHFESVGAPGGLHVSQEDRDRWDANSNEEGPTSLVKNQKFTGNGTEDDFTITNGVPQQINYVSVGGSIQDPTTYSLVGTNLHFNAAPANAAVIIVSYFTEMVLGEDNTGGIYDKGSPSNITVGGLPAGTPLTGRSWQSIIEEILLDYLAPSFNYFDMPALPSIVEVGVNVGGVRAFAWNTLNAGNVAVNSIAIRDVTANALIASVLANDSAESVDVGAITNTAPMQRFWRVEGVNSLAAPFVSGNRGVTSLYPWFYGKVASAGAAPGAGRPAANQALINSGAKVVASSAGTIAMAFGSTSDDYVWFAIPASMANKNSWFVNALNNGAVGGSVSPGGNLFPDASVVSINSPTGLWAGVNYKIYIANYQSAISALMELRN